MDQDIQQRLAGKDFSGAFDLLLESYQNKVFRLAWSLLGNAALAEEAAQEAFLKIWQALPRYQPERGSLGTWLYAITRNVCLTQLRRSPVSREAPVEESRDARITAFEMRDLLAHLTEIHRRVLTLFYFEDRSYEEVSAMLGIPMGTVKSHLHRAKKELAALAAPRAANSAK
jgi:RNA polymerase sigma-70 factor (ECF subfamily)